MRSRILHRTLAIALIAGCFCAAVPSAESQTDELRLLLDRAAEYVAAYEDTQLGNVLAAETYLQAAVTFTSSTGVPRRAQRRTESDFMILLVGQDRVGVRRVNRVDGVNVKSVESDLAAMIDDSPQGVLKRLAALRTESTRYNIGPVLRSVNLPTFALSVVRRDEAHRFAFIRRGAAKINGIETVEVTFQEQRAPTLVRGSKGESLLSSGSLWIEPATGRVLKTEFEVENPFEGSKAKGRVTVTYEPSKSLGILVPEEMKEHYEAGDTIIDCTAVYSNFRSFLVEVKVEIGPAGTGK